MDPNHHLKISKIKHSGKIFSLEYFNNLSENKDYKCCTYDSENNILIKGESGDYILNNFIRAFDLQTYKIKGKYL